MKHSHSPRGGRLMIGMLACQFAINSAVSLADIPRGTLTVDRSLLRVGSHSDLAWHINYPTGVTSVVEVLTPKIAKPEKDLNMRVRVLGASFRKLKTNNGFGNNTDGVDASNPNNGGGGPTGTIDSSGTYDDEIKSAGSATDLPVEVMWSKNNSSWARIFYGTPSTITSTSIILDTTVKQNDKINFGSRCYRSGWLPLYNTAVATPNLVMLKNGDQVPSSTLAYQQGLLKSYLKPYLSSDGKTVKIGNLDFIIFYELEETDTTVSGFDLQDLVMLVTFE